MKSIFLTLLIAPAFAHACGPFFEEAPPMLPYYLDRLPAKSLGDLYVETQPAKNAPAPDDIAIAALPLQIGKMDRRQISDHIDQLLDGARAHYTDGELCNELNDIRDAVASKATDAEVADYVKWRIQNASWFAVPPPANPEEPDAGPPKLEGTPSASYLEKRAESASPQMKPQWLYTRGAMDFCAGDRYQCAKWFERVWKEFPDHPRAEAALFLSARCALRASRDNPWQAQAPDSPPPTDKEKVDDQARKQKFDAAVALFHQYLGKYPKGRFVADAYGWLGALDMDGSDATVALNDYIQQIETPGHPEVIKSALFMCEDLLSGASGTNEALFALAARHPLVAMGATYVALQSPDGGGVDETGTAEPTIDDNLTHQYRDDTARAKKWRREVLPRLAAEVAAQKNLYRSDSWPLRYLALLAQAASAAGRQDQALAITNIPEAQLQSSDDLLLARGIAFQRADRPADAIPVYQKLLALFPKSPLAEGGRLKLALALVDNHQAGLAVLQLKHLSATSRGDDEDEIYPPAYAQLQLTDSHVREDISGAEGDQVRQIIDAIYNFAPVSELAAALNDPGEIQQAGSAQKFSRAADLITQEFAAVLAQRCLAEEDFSNARRYLTAPQPFTWEILEKQFQQENLSIYEQPIYLTDKPPLLLSGTLEALTRAVDTARTAEKKAKAMMDLGDAWATGRGKLLVHPLDDSITDTLFHADSGQALERRRENGRALGFKNVDDDLENRDELRHAARWWMRAARIVPGTPLAAAARLKALEAMPQIAGGSDYAFVRAAETNAAAASRELYQRLRTERPASDEAKNAAYWSFPMRQPAAGDEFPKFNVLGSRQLDAIGQMGYAYSDYSAFGIQTDFVEEEDIGDSNSTEWAHTFYKIAGLAAEAKHKDTAQLAAEVETLQHDVQAHYTSIGQTRYFNVLDDLALFLKEPNILPETRAAYFELRLRVSHFLEEGNEDDQEHRIEQLLADPALTPVADYVAYIKANDTSADQLSSDATIAYQNSVAMYKNLEGRMRNFLSTYPKSRKREAAMMVLARAVHWLTTPCLKMWSPKDDAEEPSMAMEIDNPETLTTKWREKFDYKRAIQPLDTYDHEFPNGRYAADIRIYRASAALRAHDWPTALDAALAGLNDKAHPDLQPESSLILANIFGQLANADGRADLLTAIHQHPEALSRLQDYLKATWDNRDHPLRYLGDYLGNRLGFHLTEPPPPPDPNGA